MQGHTIFAEESKTFESHTVSLAGSFSSVDKIRSVIAEEHGCYILVRDPNDPSKSRFGCRDPKLPEEMRSTKGFTFEECCVNNALYAEGGNQVELKPDAFCMKVPFMRKMCAYVVYLSFVAQEDHLQRLSTHSKT